MNFNTIKQELNKKIKKMSESDYKKFINELNRIFYKDKCEEVTLKGHWIPSEDTKNRLFYYKCSECGIMYSCVKTKFCPGCGAEMEE